MPVQFSYDFEVSNPMLLLGSRWQYLLKESQIIRFVKRKQHIRRAEAASRFHIYRQKHRHWLLRTRELEMYNSELLASRRKQKKVDIYGKDGRYMGMSAVLSQCEPSPSEQDDCCKYVIYNRIVENHIGKHSVPRMCPYAKKLPTLEMTPKAVLNPVGHAARADGVLWTKCEIAQFLAQFFSYPKDFNRMATQLVHKEMQQLIQFYYEFKYHFELKLYVCSHHFP